MNRIAPALAALLLGALLVGGCSVTSTGPHFPEDEYPLRDSPDNVLEKLTMAYEGMDAQAYLDCLADSFVFYLNPDDWQDPYSGLPEYWHKTEETVIHETMFGDSTDVASITLTMTLLTSEFDPNDPLDSADDRWEYVMDIDLRVHLQFWLTYWASGPVCFVFQEDPVDEGPEGERLREVVEQYDLEPTGERAGEDTSWGAIKALYGGWRDRRPERG